LVLELFDQVYSFVTGCFGVGVLGVTAKIEAILLSTVSNSLCTISFVLSQVSLGLGNISAEAFTSGEEDFVDLEVGNINLALGSGDFETVGGAL
jgi:hypothetical protein